MKKNSNKGFTSMEIIIATVILAVVVIGVLIAVKLVSGDKNKDTDMTGERVAESVSNMISGYVTDADLDIVFNLNTLKIIGRESYQIFFYDTDTKTVYYQDKTYVSPEASDTVHIEAAKQTSLDTSSATSLATNVSTFIVDIDDLTKEGAKIVVKIRVADGNFYKEYTMPVNENLIAYKNGTYDPTKVTPEEPTDTPEADPTDSPVPSPTTVVEPEPTLTTPPENDERTREDLGAGQVTLKYDDMKAAPEGAVIVVTIEFVQEKEIKTGWGLGGICVGGWSCEKDKFEYVIDHEPELGEVITYEVLCSDLIAYADELETTEFHVNFYNGFDCTKVELVY